MIRTVLTCKAHSGVCAKCYGMNLATQNPVGPGEAVGIIAAQSIGEPGTQLTMRTFHTGGLAGGDITQGLPRVEELFEARRPKRMATLSEISGTVKFEEAAKGSLLNIIVTADDGDTRTYAVPHTGLQVKDGQVIEAGYQLTYGALNPHDVLRIRGNDAVYNYLIQEVLRVYRQQGVDINDKHIEVIVRQMMRKVRLEDAGDTKLLDGSMVDVLELDAANEEIERRNAAGERQENGEPLRKAMGTQLLMGITKASLATDSFLSAASFQETTKVLTEAAIKGKADRLVGLKENVIIGKLIPAGTGLTTYQNLAEEIVPQSRPCRSRGGGRSPPWRSSEPESSHCHDKRRTGLRRGPVRLFHCSQLGSGRWDDEGLIAVVLIRYGSGGQENHYISLLIDFKLRGFIHRDIVCQGSLIPDGIVLHGALVLHPVVHLHGDGLHQIGLVILPQKIRQGRSAFSRGDFLSRGAGRGIGGRLVRGLGLSAAGGQGQKQAGGGRQADGSGNRGFQHIHSS